MEVVKLYREEYRSRIQHSAAFSSSRGSTSRVRRGLHQHAAAYQHESIRVYDRSSKRQTHLGKIQELFFFDSPANQTPDPLGLELAASALSYRAWLSAVVGSWVGTGWGTVGPSCSCPVLACLKCPVLLSLNRDLCPSSPLPSSPPSPPFLAMSEITRRSHSRFSNLTSLFSNNRRLHSATTARAEPCV
jgi:hypothetical protein